jgi:outer membrane immunogenic protein
MFVKLALSAALLVSVSFLPANAADLPSRKSAIAAPATSFTSWTGVYGGLNFGFTFNARTHSVDTDDGLTDQFNGINGILAGGQLGADRQIGKYVLGLSLDYNKSWASRNFIQPQGGQVNIAANFVGTLRARIGYVLSDAILSYITAGWAFTNLPFSYAGPGGPLNQSQIFSGYALGAGLEYKHTQKISSFAELRYDTYGPQPYPIFSIKIDRRNGEVRTGINYRF